MILKKKATTALSVPIGIFVIVLAGVVLLFFVGRGLGNIEDDKIQKDICQSVLISAHMLREGESTSKMGWMMDLAKNEIATTLMKNPLCTTAEIEIDLTSSNNLARDTGVHIGNMIHNCWRSFGEGKIPNTFGQRPATLVRRHDQNNYYFSCYRFKISMPSNRDYVKVEDINKILWTYNVKGREIEMLKRDGSVENQLRLRNEYLTSGDKDYLSYAGYVFWEGYGYLGFAESISEDVNYNPDWRKVGAGGVILGAVLLSNPAGWAGAAVLSIIGGVAAMTSINEVRNNVEKLPGVENQLDTFYPESWYEVRYYSAYVKETDNSESIALNSIMIVPLGTEDGSTSRIRGIND